MDGVSTPLLAPLEPTPAKPNAERRIGRRSWLALAVLFVAACASSGRSFDSTKVSQIQKGTTTRAEIESWFGPPQQRQTLSAMPNGATLRYVYAWGHASWGGAKSTGKSLVVDFDAKDVVADHAYSEQ